MLSSSVLAAICSTTSLSIEASAGSFSGVGSVDAISLFDELSLTSWLSVLFVETTLFSAT